MKLQRITGRRDQTRHAIDLDPARPVLFVTGPNESGKTTLLHLVEYAVLGPSRASHPVDTEADLVFDAFSVYRRTGPDRDHELTTTVLHPSGHRNATVKIRDGEAAIAAALGPLRVFEAGALFNATPPERRKLLAPLLAPALTREAFREAFVDAKVNASSLPPAIREATNPSELERHREGLEWAQAWIAQLRAAKNTLQGRAEAARQTVASFTDRLAAAGVEAGSLQHWQERVAAAEAVVVRARTARDEQRHLGQAISAATARVAAASQASERPGRAVQARAAVVQAEAELVKVRAAEEAAAKAVTDARAVVEREVEALERVEAARSKHLDHTAAVQLAPHLRPLLAAVSDHLDHTAAVQLAPHLRPLLAAVSDLARHADAVAAATALEALLGAEAVAAANALRHLLDSEPDGISEDQLGGARTRVSAAERRVAAAGATLAGNTAAVTRAAEALAKAQAAVPAAEREDEAQRTAALAELEAARAALAELPSTTDASTLQDAVAAAEAELAANRVELARVQAYATLTADHDAAVTRAQECAAARSELHHVEKRAEEAFARVMGVAVGRVANTATGILRQVLGPTSAVGIDPALGWDLSCGGRVVEHLSESVTVMLGLALQAAARQLVPGWRAVLVDGLEVVEDSRRLRLLTAMAEVGLDNVIACAVADGVVPRSPLVQVVTLRRAT